MLIHVVHFFHSSMTVSLRSPSIRHPSETPTRSRRPPPLPPLQQRLSLLPHPIPPHLIYHRVARRPVPLLLLPLIPLRSIHFGLVPLREVLDRLRPHKRLLQLDRHRLGRSGPVPAVWSRSAGFRVVGDDAGLFDVGANAEDADVVDMVEVVSQIELAEPEGDGEAGELGGEAVRAVEDDGEVGSMGGNVSLVFCSMCYGQTYRKTSFVPTRNGASAACAAAIGVVHSPETALP